MDRNKSEDVSYNITIKSLSARRAWIEILESKQIDPSVMVALRKESVDRNNVGITTIDCIIESLSARRAWIEISNTVARIYPRSSLSARRAWIEIPYSGQSTVAQ